MTQKASIAQVVPTAAAEPSVLTPLTETGTEEKQVFSDGDFIIQLKLTVGSVDDPMEEEADNMADRIMRMPSSDFIQRKCAHCEEEDQIQRKPLATFIQRKATETGNASVNDATHNNIRSSQGMGTGMDSTTKDFMETRFGTDFGNVNIHTGASAEQLSRDLNAKAFTVGRDIYFNQGQYQPNTDQGKHLLAHELTHTIQQGNKNFSRVQRVQLTYDDGPDSAGNTRSVLNSLNAAGAKATFYLVGKKIAQGDGWRIVFDIAAAGHWLGNHAYDWNDTTDDHIFLKGTTQERAEKILQTEWVIRDALIQGRDDAVKNNKWTTIAQANRDYIDDTIAHGTGRFRTPGFRSHFWTSDGTTTMAAIANVNQVLAATGLYPLKITEVGTISREGVTVDPEDWRKGRTQAEIEAGVKGGLSDNSDSILLHSRIAATAAATPAVIGEIKAQHFSFDPTIKGSMGQVAPKPGFAGLSTISSPPTSAEVAAARAFLKKDMLSFGPYISGAVALGIFQLAQLAGAGEVSSFAAEIKATNVSTKTGVVPMANWMNANPEWSLFTGFFENWMTRKPFPRIAGVTI